MRNVLDAAAAVGVAGIGHSTPNLPLASQLEWPWAEIHHLDFQVEELLPPERRTRLPVSPWGRMLIGRVRFDPAAQEAAAFAARLALHGVAWVPTLTVTRGPCGPECWELIRVTAAPGDSSIVREAVFDAASQPRSASDSAEATRAASLRFVNQWIALLHAAGVPILAGSDAPAGGPFGSTLHAELEYLVAAGLSAMEALAAASRKAAEALGLSHRVGTVSARKLADFIVLDADPLADIRNSRAIRFVVFNGSAINFESGASGPELPHGAMKLTAQTLKDDRRAATRRPTMELRRSLSPVR